MADEIPITLNSDVGEGAGFDDQIIPLVQAVNISCGAHAGTPQDIAQAVELALDHGCQIGAHPGYPDPENFGRVDLALSTAELRETLHAQLDSLSEVVEEKGGVLSYIKPHGALYNRMAQEPDFAGMVFGILQDWRPLPVMVLAGSPAIEVAKSKGVIAEGFLDRAYTDAGLLVPRSNPGAVIVDITTAKAQAKAMLYGEPITALSGKKISLKVDSICVHGDTAGAVDFLRAVLG